MVPVACVCAIMANRGKTTATASQSKPGRKSPQSLPDWTAAYAEQLRRGSARFRIITMERECACGAAAIAKKLSNLLGWKLWDQLLAQEITDQIRSDLSTARKQAREADGRFCRMAQVFWRGSYERSAALDECRFVDPDGMVVIMQKVSEKIAREGNAIVVGRGAPGFLQDRNDAFHVFFYASRSERIRRLLANGKSESDAELVEAVDRERGAFVKTYFGGDWPTRSVYDVMINTAIGEHNCVATILHTMLLLEQGKR